jgi:hypothetical protein
MMLRLWYAFMLFVGASAGTLLAMIVMTGSVLNPMKELKNRYPKVASNVTALFVMEVALAILMLAITFLVK